MNKDNKIRLFDIEIDRLTMEESVKKVSSWVDAASYHSHYVVTPNVDHIVKLTKNMQFKSAYENASMVVTDGRPVVFASRILGKTIPEVVPGSDLVPSIFDYYQSKLDKKLKVFLLGAMPGVAERAAFNIQSQWPNIQVVGLFSPQFGFEKSTKQSEEICELINETMPDIVVFGVGAPKQEIWCDEYATKVKAKAILCVGATIDFLAGEKRRAPVWMRKVGLEWLHRMSSEPKRLLKRYTVDALVFPLLVWREWNKKSPVKLGDCK